MAFRRQLAYTGVAAPTPPNQILNTRQPTANDYQSFNIGDLWIVPTSSIAPSEEMWVLMSKEQNVAVWVQVNAGGATTYNNHEILVGTGTPTINTLNNATAGLPLLTQGAGADPTWGVLQVPGGGTGASTFVAYAPVVGGTTSTNPLQSVVSAGTAGQVLHSNGAGVLPSWQGTGPIGAITNIVVQVLTTPGAGTYTPTTGMVQCIVECLGGGGGGGGAISSGTGAYMSAGGGAGGYCKKVIDAATVGVSKAVVIGAGGAGGVGNTIGTTGVDTTFGVILTASGGVGSLPLDIGASFVRYGAVGGIASGGDSNTQGQYGGSAISFADGAPAHTIASGNGADSLYGVGGKGVSANSGSILGINGNAGIGYGSGGSGSIGPTGGAFTLTGGSGAGGIIIITEYIQ